MSTTPGQNLVKHSNQAHISKELNPWQIEESAYNRVNSY